MNRPVARSLTGVISLCALVAVAGCQGESEPPKGTATGEKKPVVYVVNYPLKYFADRIGGQAVAVEFPAPAGRDPASWKPDATAVLGYQKADLILLNGAGYAKWVERATLPQAKLVDTSAKFRDRLIIVEDAVTHSHGPGGEHSHAGPASTTWLDLSLAVEHARAVKDAFVKLWPNEATTFDAGFAALEKDLVDLDKRFAAVALRQPDAPLLASHPVYQYLERRYKLNLKSLHWEPDEMPEEAMWTSLAEMLKDHPAKWMIWEGKPLEGSAEKLKALGVGSVVVSLGGNVPEKGDFLDLMRENLTSLEQALSDP